MRITILSTSHTGRLKRAASVLFILCLLAGGAQFARAAWDGMPYDPEETLNPECSPTDPECRITRPVNTGEGIPAGSIPYTSGTDQWDALGMGGEGQVLKVLGGMLAWGTDTGGVTYSASEQGLHLSSTTNVFSLSLDGTSLTQSADGLRVSSAYAGQNTIATVGTITSGAWQGATIAPQYGGTGATAAPSNGQLLIGNGSTYSVANITGTDGVTVTNGAGSLSLGMSVNGLSAISTPAAGDYLMLYQASSGTNRKVSISDFTSSMMASGALEFEGTWNANTNTPSITDGMCSPNENGHFYIVSTAGTTTLGGNSSWSAGDWVMCNGTSWTRVPNTNSLASVFGRTGAVTAQNGDYTAAQITNVASGTIAATTLQGAVNELATEKENVIAPGLTSQYWRGDKTWQTLDTLAVTENPVHLYYTDARARNAFSSGSASLTYDPVTGVLAVTSGYSIPQSGTTNGDTLVWDGANWTPTGGLVNYSTGGDLVSINGTASTTALRVSTDAVIASSTIANLHAGTLGLSSALDAGSGGTGITNPTSAGLLIGTNGGGAWAQVATSSLGISLADTTGTLPVARGGIGLTVAPAFGQLLMGNGSGGYALAATSTLGLNLSTLSGTLGVNAGGTGSAGLGQGWLYSPGGGIALAASTSPTVNYLVATSTTQASTFAGKVGIGTTSPLATLSVRGGGTGNGIALQTTGSTNLPGLTVLDSGSVGIGTSSPGALLSIAASVNTPSLLVASTSGVSLAVGANGFVGIGVGTPNYPLDVRGDVGGTVARFQTGGGSLLCALSAVTGLISCTSDENLKKDITSLPDTTFDKVMALRPVSYRWKTDDASAGLKYGFIAQEVEKLFPSLVTTDETTGYKTLSVNGLMPFVVKAIQEQQAAIDALAENKLAATVVDIDQLAQNGALTLAGHIAFGGDTVGEATVDEGDTETEISFDRAYGSKPLVTVTPEDELEGAYWVTNVSTHGFTIKVASPQAADVTFAWHAFAKTDRGSVPPPPSAQGSQPPAGSPAPSEPTPQDQDGAPAQGGDSSNASGTTPNGAGEQPSNPSTPSTPANNDAGNGSQSAPAPASSGDQSGGDAPTGTPAS